MPPLVCRTLLAAAALGVAACSSETPTEPAQKTDVTLKFCGGAPAWVAYQDEGGAWTEVEGVVTGQAHAYSFKMAPLGGIAYVQTLTCSSHSVVVYGTAAELGALFDGSYCGAASGLKTIHGSLAGGIAGGYSNVAMGGFGGGHANVAGESGNFTLKGVRSGPQDLVAARGTSSGTDRAIIRRGLDVPDGTTIPVLDFNSNEAIKLDSGTVSIVGWGSNSSLMGGYVSSSFYLATGAWGSGSTTAAGPTARYRGLPASAMIAGDMNYIAIDVGGRALDMFVGPVANVTATLGPAPASPALATVSAGTPTRMRMTTPVQAEYPEYAVGQFWGGTRPYYYVSVQMTSAYRRGASSWRLEAPDFGASSGYDVSWAIPAGMYRGWTSRVYGWDLTKEFVPAVGLTRRLASLSGSSALASASPSFGRLDGQVREPTFSANPSYEQRACSTP